MTVLWTPLLTLRKAPRVAAGTSGIWGHSEEVWRFVHETMGGVLRGNTIRGNRPERFWEGNLPLRGSLRGPLRGMVSELFRAFQRFLEVFRGFQRFSEVFRGFSKALSETLSECHFPLRVAGRVAPSRVAPWNSCKTTGLAEAQPVQLAPGLLNSETCKRQSRRDAPKLAVLEAPCAQHAPGRSNYNAPTGSIATQKPHFGDIPLLSGSFSTPNSQVCWFSICFWVGEVNQGILTKEACFPWESESP